MQTAENLTIDQIREELPLLKITYMNEDPAPQCDDEAVTQCDDEAVTQPGFYYYFGFAGCLPDSDLFGPFESELLAAQNAFDIHAN